MFVYYLQNIHTSGRIYEFTEPREGNSADLVLISSMEIRPTDRTVLEPHPNTLHPLINPAAPYFTYFLKRSELRASFYDYVESDNAEGYDATLISRTDLGYAQLSLVFPDPVDHPSNGFDISPLDAPPKNKPMKKRPVINVEDNDEDEEEAEENDAPPPKRTRREKKTPAPKKPSLRRLRTKQPQTDDDDDDDEESVSDFIQDDNDPIQYETGAEEEEEEEEAEEDNEEDDEDEEEEGFHASLNYKRQSKAFHNAKEKDLVKLAGRLARPPLQAYGSVEAYEMLAWAKPYKDMIASDFYKNYLEMRAMQLLNHIGKSNNTHVIAFVAMIQKVVETPPVWMQNRVIGDIAIMEEYDNYKQGKCDACNNNERHLVVRLSFEYLNDHNDITTKEINLGADCWPKLLAYLSPMHHMRLIANNENRRVNGYGYSVFEDMDHPADELTRHNLDQSKVVLGYKQLRELLMDGGEPAAACRKKYARWARAHSKKH